MHTKQQLHNGPIHVPSSTSPVSWEFAIEIPTRPSPRAVASEMKDPEASYMPLSTASIADYALPSTFATAGRRRNTRFEAYVEYHLEATLIQQGAGSRYSSSDSLTASLPLIIKTVPMPYPLTDFDPQRRSVQLAASSYRLVPGMEGAELTFKQKSKKFFGSSKVPLFAFTLQYDCPSVIQLDNPTPIPFRMRVVPDGLRTSEVLRGAPQVVVLGSLEMVLKADTSVIAPGHFGSHTGEDTVKHNISLPVAFAGSVPASVLKTVNRDVKGDEPAGKEAAHQGAVHRPVSGGAKMSAAEHLREEQGESSSSSQNHQQQQPARLSKEEDDTTGQGPAAAAALEAYDEPPAGESSSPPTYQPRADDGPPPPAAAAEKSPPPPPQAEQPPAYQPAPAAAAAPRDPHSRGPLVIPSAWDTTGNGAWIDVGAALGLRLHETHATCRGQSVSRMALEPVSPGFTTYCIRHTHRLKWKISISVGGERIEAESEGPVTVVGAAEAG